MSSKGKKGKKKEKELTKKEIKKEIETCKGEIKQLEQQIAEIRPVDGEAKPLVDAARKRGVEQLQTRMKDRRTMKGHFGKIYSLHWGPKRYLVSAAQDGKLIIWDAWTTFKAHAIPLRSSWVMTCAYSPSGNFVACGGLDDTCTVFNVPKFDGEGKMQEEQTSKHYALTKHEGYLSCCRFISDEEMLTSSGDSTLILWDLETRKAKSTFRDHTGDCMTLSIIKNTTTFLSASVDATAKMWDWRQKKKSISTFRGHESDINTIQAFPDGNAFATGSDDSTCRLFDIRASQQVNIYLEQKIVCGATSVDFSDSGKYLFAGYDNFHCMVWDTQLGTLCDDLIGHENRVSCVGVSRDGKALCTGSWDAALKVWA